MINWLKLGSKNQDMRKARRMTQQQLAEVTDISIVYLGFIEQGKRRCSIESYIRIVNALGYTLDDLFNDYLRNVDPQTPINMKQLIADCNEVERKAIYGVINACVDMVKVTHPSSDHDYSILRRGK